MTSALARLLSLLCLVCLTSTTRAEDRAAPIRDDARLFHTDAVARAEKRIDDIHREFDRNLFVQTVVSASPHQRRLFRFLRTPEVNRLLEEQARKYADEAGLPGIYVVICKKPQDVHVIVRPGDDPHFTRHDVEALRRTLARHRWDSSGADTALLALVEQGHAILQGHAMRGDEQSVVNEFVLAGLLGGGGVLWMLLSMIRYKMRAGQPAEAGEVDPSMQARVRPALLGAMFGFPAGVWIYDKLYPCPSGTPLPLCEPEAEPGSAVDEESMERTQPEEHLPDEHTEDAPVSP